MRVLVTGGCGVIGSTIAHRLTEAGHTVDVIDAMEAPRNDWIAARLPVASILKARLEQFSPEALADLLSDADAVIHAAASTGIPHSVLNPDDDWRSNVDATRVLLEALRKRPLPTVVLSSVKPYLVQANQGDWAGLKETTPLVPDEPYAASKAAQSMLAMAYGRSYGIPAVTFRCSNLYGPAPCHGPRHGWLTWFAISAAIGRPIEVQGTGEQTRDMLHADDVYTACVAAIDNADRLGGQVFNLGGGADNRISVSDAARELATLGSVLLKSAPARAMDDLHVFANSGAFLRETGWHPQVNVRDGLRSVFDWAKANESDLRWIYG